MHVNLTSLLLDLEDLKSLHAKNNIKHFQIRRLESLRFWLLHAIGSIHAYLSGQVLQSLGFMFDQSLTQADSLDAVISGIHYKKSIVCCLQFSTVIFFLFQSTENI